MQLFAELPDLVAMFLCGFLAYMSVEWLKKRAAASARHRQKLEGLSQATATCTAARTAATTNPTDLAACKETMKQPNHEQPNPRTKRVRNKKVAQKTCKAIHPVSAHDEQPCARDSNMDSPGGTTTGVHLEDHHLADNMPTVGTSAADKPPPPVISAETAGVSVEERGNAPADDGSIAGWECMTLNIDDAEADDEAAAEATFTAKIQEAGADNHEGLQGWCADADVEQLCQQPVPNLEQELQIQGDGMKETQQLMAHDTSENKKKKQKKQKQERETETETKPEQNKEREENDKHELVGEKEELEHGQQEVELLQATPADEEQCHLCERDLGEWPETTDDEGSMNDHSSKSQYDNHLSREEERRRVLTSDWADAKDEEEWSEFGHEAMHPSCLQFINGWSGKRKQGSQLNIDDWMAPFAPADCKVPGWFTDDKWFGNGQCCNGGQLEKDGEAEWWAENDCWMTPFDEIIQRTTSYAIAESDASTTPSMNSPMGPAVCIWNAGSSILNAGSSTASDAGGDSSGEIFTDGQQVFQSVPSPTGQPLFTDGKQLYASVCVVVGPSDEAVDPTSDAAMCGPGAANPSYGQFDEPFCTAVGGGAED